MTFFFNNTSTTQIYTLSLHDALPISTSQTIDTLRGLPTKATDANGIATTTQYDGLGRTTAVWGFGRARRTDRKSTRLNSSHSQISYAVFCLEKKQTTVTIALRRTTTM